MNDRISAVASTLAATAAGLDIVDIDDDNDGRPDDLDQDDNLRDNSKQPDTGLAAPDTMGGQGAGGMAPQM